MITFMRGRYEYAVDILFTHRDNMRRSRYNDIVIMYMSAITHRTAAEDIQRALAKKGNYSPLVFSHSISGEIERYAMHSVSKCIVNRIPQTDYARIIIATNTQGTRTYESMVESCVLMKNGAAFKKAWEDNKFEPDAFKEEYANIAEIIKRRCNFSFETEWIVPVLTYMSDERYARRHSEFIHPAYVDERIIDKVADYRVFNFDFGKSDIKAAITSGIRSGKIRIGDGRESLSYADYSNNLEEYVERFGANIADKAYKEVTPLYKPGHDIEPERVTRFADNVSYCSDIELFPAQRDIISAVMKRLEKHRQAIIVADMGTGKTVMSIGAIYALSKKKNESTFVICPSHLVEKWKREIARFFPAAYIKICGSIGEFQTDVEPVLNNKNRKNNLFVIFSKEALRGNEGEWEPIVKFNNDRQRVICPVCGKGTYYMYDTAQCNVVKITPLHRDRPGNGKCGSCGTIFWQPATGKENKYFYYVPGRGWLPKEKRLKHITLSQIMQNASSTPAKNMARDVLSVDEHSYPARNKCSISLSDYIHKKYSNKIDFLIVDEIHQYTAPDSLQGKMFAKMVRAAKKTIGLTGTLINGYAENLFYLLFRINPGPLVKDGFKWNDKHDFIDKFGTIERAIKRNSRGVFAEQKKVLPGISPAVFSRYLMDCCVFAGIDDMSGILPSYREIPVPVDMNTDIRREYDNLIRIARDNLNSDSVRALSCDVYAEHVDKLIRLLRTYPDKPYRNVPVYDDLGNKVYDIPNLNSYIDKETAKETETFNTAKRHLDRGECVLIYYTWTNTTDSADRLLKMFKEAGYPADILNASVTAKKRERWIEDKVKSGTRVLLCNPTLVETGLDLLDFTTIIYYQPPNRLSTMRQSSRRSYRLNQTKPVTVYFLYYNRSVEESALSVLATKLHAAVALEGKFNADGLAAMNSTSDINARIAQSIMNDETISVDIATFSKTDEEERARKIELKPKRETHQYDIFKRKASKAKPIELIRDYYI